MISQEQLETIRGLRHRLWNLKKLRRQLEAAGQDTAAVLKQEAAVEAVLRELIQE